MLMGIRMEGAANEFLQTLNMAIPLQPSIHWGYVIAIIGCQLSGINPNLGFWVYLQEFFLDWIIQGRNIHLKSGPHFLVAVYIKDMK